jgi:hypothetical protein
MFAGSCLKNYWIFLKTINVPSRKSILKMSEKKSGP